MKDNENKQVNGANSAPIAVAQECPKATETFDFIKSFVEHIKNIFNKFSKKTLSSIENEEFIALGRSEEEKAQIAEMCHNVDEEYELLAEVRNSNLAPEVWLQNKTQEILQDCSYEEKDAIIQAVEEEGKLITVARAEDLNEIIDEIKKSQNVQTEE